MFVGFCLVMLVLLEDARREGNSTLALEYRYKLFELRDELRNHVIAHPELSRDWVFLYLDSTITKFVGLLPKLSIWHMLALLFVRKNDLKMKRLREHLEREYSKPQHVKFKQIEIKLMAIFGQYIGKKHAFLRKASSFIAMNLVRSCLTVIKKIRRDSLEVAVEAPETSTLGDYCPA